MQRQPMPKMTTRPRRGSGPPRGPSRSGSRQRPSRAARCSEELRSGAMPAAHRTAGTPAALRAPGSEPLSVGSSLRLELAELPVAFAHALADRLEPRGRGQRSRFRHRCGSARCRAPTRRSMPGASCGGRHAILGKRGRVPPGVAERQLLLRRLLATAAASFSTTSAEAIAVRIPESRGKQCDWPAVN